MTEQPEEPVFEQLNEVTLHGGPFDGAAAHAGPDAEEVTFTVVEGKQGQRREIDYTYRAVRRGEHGREFRWVDPNAQ